MTRTELVTSATMSIDMGSPVRVPLTHIVSGPSIHAEPLGSLRASAA
jgi:hypothetical protein